MRKRRCRRRKTRNIREGVVIEATPIIRHQKEEEEKLDDKRKVTKIISGEKNKWTRESKRVKGEEMEQRQEEEKNGEEVYITARRRRATDVYGCRF